MLDNHLDVYQCYNNLIRVNSALTIKTKKGEKNIVRTPWLFFSFLHFCATILEKIVRVDGKTIPPHFIFYFSGTVT